MGTAHSGHVHNTCNYYETTRNNGPVDDSSDWATEEATTAADRHDFLEFDPAFIRQKAVADARMSPRVYKKASRKPIKGLRTAEGGSSVLVMNGSESSTAAASQVTETGLMRHLEHSLGGLSRGYSSAISAVTNDTSFTLTTTTGFDEGVMYAVEDADDANRLWPVRALTDGGAGVITTDRDFGGFNVSTSDTAHAVAMIYIDQDALTNPSDGSASTVSILHTRGGDVWEVNGCAYQLDTVDFPRGEVPKFNFSISGAYVRPEDDGAPAAPTFTGTVQGAAGIVVGADTYLHVQAKGTTTENLHEIVSGTLTVGVPRIRMDGITGSSVRAQGTHGFTTAPADTILEIQAYMQDATFQDWWDAGTALVVSLFQVAPAGSGWIVHGSDAILMEPPEPVVGNESNLQTLRFEFREDASLDATATNLDRARSKLIIGLY